MSWKQPQHPMRVAIVIGAILIGANVLYWGGRAQVNGAAQKQRPVDIQSLSPNEGDLIPPQGAIIVDLRDQYQGQISVDGQLIPKDEMTGVPDLGIIEFDPGPGKTFREFSDGAHNAEVEWWPRTISTPEEARAKQLLGSYTWAFNVG